MQRKSKQLSLFLMLCIFLTIPQNLLCQDGPTRFNCKNNKWIKAQFFESPVPYVALELSDGRKMNLAQALSASGVRFTNVTDTIEFWNKGDGAWLEEAPMGEDPTLTFEDCEESKK